LNWRPARRRDHGQHQLSIGIKGHRRPEHGSV
jgi:hypothetical protein